MQPSLFDDIKTAVGMNEPETPALARRSDPPSSKIAAKQFVQSGALKGDEELIVWLSDVHRGYWTAHELAKLSKEKHGEINAKNDVQISRRLAGLEQKNVLERGEVRKCTCRYGCNASMQEWRSKRVTGNNHDAR